MVANPDLFIRMFGKGEMIKHMSSIYPYFDASKFYGQTQDVNPDVIGIFSKSYFFDNCHQHFTKISVSGSSNLGGHSSFEILIRSGYVPPGISPFPTLSFNNNLYGHGGPIPQLKLFTKTYHTISFSFPRSRFFNISKSSNIEVTFTTESSRSFINNLPTRILLPVTDNIRANEIYMYPTGVSIDYYVTMSDFVELFAIFFSIKYSLFGSLLFDSLPVHFKWLIQFHTEKNFSSTLGGKFRPTPTTFHTVNGTRDVPYTQPVTLSPDDPVVPYVLTAWTFSRSYKICKSLNNTCVGWKLDDDSISPIFDSTILILKPLSVFTLRSQTTRIEPSSFFSPETSLSDSAPAINFNNFTSSDGTTVRINFRLRESVVSNIKSSIVQIGATLHFTTAFGSSQFISVGELIANPAEHYFDFSWADLREVFLSRVVPIESIEEPIKYQSGTGWLDGYCGSYQFFSPTAEKFGDYTLSPLSSLSRYFVPVQFSNLYNGNFIRFYISVSSSGNNFFYVTYPFSSDIVLTQILPYDQNTDNFLRQAFSNKGGTPGW